MSWFVSAALIEKLGSGDGVVSGKGVLLRLRVCTPVAKGACRQLILGTGLIQMMLILLRDLGGTLSCM